MQLPYLDRLSINDEQSWINIQRMAVTQYSVKIESCIDRSAWQMLAFVLSSRELFLRNLYSAEVADHLRPQLKMLAEEIIEQDRGFNQRIEAHKNIVQQQQLALGRNKRALSKYGQANSF